MSRRDLLKPFSYSFRNRFFPAGSFPWKTVTVIMLGIAICLGLYLISVKVVGYFHQQSELGIILSLKIFQMAWIIMFSMLVFSCMVSAVSSMFLSQDNEIVCAAPVPNVDLYAMRFVTTTIYTSWMMVVFSIPIFAGYGTVFKADWLYWMIMPFTVTSVAAIATGFGNTVTILLVNIFPARRTKDIILYLSLCFGIFIYIIFRLLKPEELINPDRFGHFVDYLSSISTPAAPYIPAAWAANFLSLYLLDREIDWLLMGLLIITPVALFFIGEWVMQKWFSRGYSKSQESFGGYRRFGFRRKYRPGVSHWIAAKETKSFLRDSAEWSQLFMIAALVLVYLYNFKMLPVDRSFFAEEYVTNIISFLNIGLTGFIIASLSARFVYPSVGSEGGAFYIIRAAPISLGRFLFHKYLYYVTPFTILALVMVVISDHLLNITGPMLWFSIGTTILICWVVVAVALGFGAIHADFKAENRAAALGGMGAILFLFTAMTYETIIITIGFVPTYRIVGKWLRHSPLNGSDLALMSGWIFFAVTSGIIIAVFFFRKGVKSLQDLP